MRISNCRQWCGGIFLSIIFLFVLTTSLPASTSCENKTQPIYDSAVVDGNAGEWIPADDFFAPMYRAGQTNKDILSNAYLRYDCTANVLYVLVEKATSYKIMAQDGNEVWVKIDGSKKVSSDDEGASGTTTFSWINKNGSYADGWEASFSLAEGSYSIIIHNNVWDGESQTSSTDKNGLDLFLQCPGIDYGDAPNSMGFNYGSAGHKIVSGLIVYMGSMVDDESSYSGDPNAATDDGTGSDDEDGVSFSIQNTDGTWTPVDGSEFYKGRTYKVVVSVTLAGCTSAKLAAWFDFFVDGEFGNEPEETIIDNVVIDNSSSITETSNYEQEFTVPSGSNEGTTYLRFRLDAQSDDLTPTGIGHVGGEVEDYVTSIGSAPPVSVTLTSFEAIMLDDGVKIKWQTASEINHAGYNLYRSDAEEGAYEKINDILIAVPENALSTVGGRYEFVDADAAPSSWYKLESIELDGSSEFFGPVQASTSTGVESQNAPTDFTLRQNYPNPFNPSTTIEYALPKTADVSLVIYDIQGKVVKTLVNGMQPAGRYTVVWDATNMAGERASSGLYFYRIKAGAFTKLSRMTLLK